MDLNSHVKSMIEVMTCPIHHQNPSVILLDKQIEILCCCTDFKITCLKKMTDILIHHRDHTVNVVWKKPE